MSGLLIEGQLYPVPGVTIIGAHETAWAHLDPGDGGPRARRPHQWVLHKTLADDREHVLPGKGRPGGAERTAEYWQGDPKHSGAHLVTGDDGVVACLADLSRWMAYHARAMNAYSVGIETREKVGGGVYQAALDATVAVTLAGCELLGIQLQIPKAYHGRPLHRMHDGGRTCVGIFGHRDGDANRDEHDPGEILFEMLMGHGVEAFDFDLEVDRVVWRERQGWLLSRGHSLVLDGIPGPKTTAALKAEGFRGGIWALGPITDKPTTGPR